MWRWGKGVTMAASEMSMSCDVALAKIKAPRRTFLSVDRDGALKSLVECLNWKIVTVEAPPGSAKSSLLAEACRRLGEDPHWETAWLSVDEADDCDRFCRHALAALRTLWPELDDVELMRLHRESPRLCTVSLSNFLLEHADGADVGYVLFVDDLHRAHPDAIDEFLNAAARFFPDNVHVVASGSHLLWEHVDLAHRDVVRMFPAEKLDFTKDEVKAMLTRALELRRTPDSPYASAAPEELDAASLDNLAESLWSATDGWSFGVRSYVDALARGAVDFTVPIDERALGQMLNRFFRSSVLDSLPDDLARFVIDVALVDSVCADLCTALTGRSDAKFVLRDLRTRGCFLVPCANEPGWYAFHPLFHRWLRMKQGQMGEQRLRELCWAANGWYEANGMAAEAAKFLLMASDSGFIESLASAVGYGSPRRGMPYAEWISRMPAERFTTSPQLALQATWGYVICARTQDGWRWADVFERAAQDAAEDAQGVSMATSLVRTKCVEMECRYDEAIVQGEAIFAHEEDRLSLSQRCLLSHLLAESYVRRGRFDEALKHYLQAEAMAELDESDFYKAMCRIGIISLHTAQGKFKEALELCERALAECPDTVLPYGSLLAAKGYLYVEMHRLDEACACVEQAHRIASASRNVDMLYEAEANRAYCYAAMGRHDQAFRLITKTSLRIGGNSVARSIHLLVHLRLAWVALSMGYVSEADASVRQLKAHVAQGDTAYELACAAVEAAVDDHAGRAGYAAEMVPLVERAHDAGLCLYELELSLRAAERYAEEGRHAEALVYLNRALQLQAGQQMYGPFLRAGRRTRALLHEVVDIRKSSGQARQLAKEVLRHFGSGEVGEELSEHASTPLARFGLTERECEVLELLDAGLSRREIADALTVSLNTVKSHVSGIYNKLGVTNRIDAFSIVHDGQDDQPPGAVPPHQG